MSDIILCAQCHRPLYHCRAISREFAGATIKAEDMVPVSESVPAPEQGEEGRCPLCNEPFALIIGDGFTFLLADGSFWPQVPPHLVRKRG